MQDWVFRLGQLWKSKKPNVITRWFYVFSWVGCPNFWFAYHPIVLQTIVTGKMKSRGHCCKNNLYTDLQNWWPSRVSPNLPNWDFLLWHIFFSLISLAESIKNCEFKWIPAWFYPNQAQYWRQCSGCNKFVYKISWF